MHNQAQRLTAWIYWVFADGYLVRHQSVGDCLNCWGFTPYRWTLPVPVKTGLSAILQHDDIARRSLAAVLLEFCIANPLSYVMSSSSTMFKLNFYYSREIKHLELSFRRNPCCCTPQAGAGVSGQGVD